MARYTREDLRFDLIALNKRVKDAGGKTMLDVEGRNGYTGLDEYNSETGRCIRNIECGTPSKCLTAALTWAIGQISDNLGA